MESNLAIEEIYRKSRLLVIDNVRKLEQNVNYDRDYAITHTKEEYLSRDDRLIQKIVDKDYEIVEGHIWVAL